MVDQVAKTRGRKTAAKAAPAKTASETKSLGKQTQATAVMDKQGASTSGKPEAAADTVGEMRGGAKQVLMTEAVLPGRGGRPAGVEEYPFSQLTPAKKDADGQIKGMSFFIPLTDRAEGKLAVARKRYREEDGSPALFWSRRVFEKVNGSGEPVEGLRIWRGSPKLKQAM